MSGALHFQLEFLQKMIESVVLLISRLKKRFILGEECHFQHVAGYLRPSTMALSDQRRG